MTQQAGAGKFLSATKHGNDSSLFLGTFNMRVNENKRAGPICPEATFKSRAARACNVSPATCRPSPSYTSKRPEDPPTDPHPPFRSVSSSTSTCSHMFAPCPGGSSVPPPLIAVAAASQPPVRMTAISVQLSSPAACDSHYGTSCSLCLFWVFFVVENLHMYLPDPFEFINWIQNGGRCSSPSGDG